MIEPKIDRSPENNYRLPKSVLTIHHGYDKITGKLISILYLNLIYNSHEYMLWTFVRILELQSDFLVDFTVDKKRTMMYNEYCREIITEII